MQKVDSTVLPTGEIFNETHHQAVLAGGVHHKGRDFALAERLIGFKPTLTAYEVISHAIRAIPAGDCDRLFEADFGDVFNDLPEYPLIPHSRIDDDDAVDGD